ncbi:MAG: hypothetical protein NVSMB31_01420 [Vulcanimicrobiaceae bacterium]
MICNKCGVTRRPFQVTILGHVRTLHGECACDDAGERRLAAENPAALRRLIEERSEVSTEFKNVKVETHPNPQARKWCNQFVEKRLPNLHESLLAARDWRAPSPSELTDLLRRQQDAVRGMRGIAFYGKQGRGKTGAMHAILTIGRERGISGMAANVRLLLDECKARYSKKNQSVDALFAPLRATPLLLLDDLDKASAESVDEIAKLYALAEYRVAHNLPIFVTANRGLAELATMFSQTFGENGLAMIDRIGKTTPTWLELVSEKSYRIQ